MLGNSTKLKDNAAEEGAGSLGHNPLMPAVSTRPRFSAISPLQMPPHFVSFREIS